MAGLVDRVLVTTAAEEADELIEALLRVALTPVLVPTVAIEPQRPRGTLDAAARHLHRYAWAIVTSAISARALVAAAERVAGRLDAPRWAAIGGPTQQILEEEGIEIDYQPVWPDAVRTAAELLLRPGDRVLVVRGDLTDLQLPIALRARGAEVDDVLAYRSFEAPNSSRALLRAALGQGPIDAVVFTSGSCVRGLAALAKAEALTEIASIPAVCIGPEAETAAEARRRGFTVVAEAAPSEAIAPAAWTAEVLRRRSGKSR